MKEIEKRLETINHKIRHKTIEEFYRFWAQFTREEIVKYGQGEAEVTNKFILLGGDKVMKRFESILTDEESSYLVQGNNQKAKASIMKDR